MTGTLRRSLMRNLLALHVAFIIRLNTVQPGDHEQGRLSYKSRGAAAADRRIAAHSQGMRLRSSPSWRGA